MTGTMKEPTITIETSCGWTFKKKPSEMTNDQLHAFARRK
jgi:hypothetical protein